MSALPAARQVRLLQLASPALPIGGYSYSGGLEWAIESGMVTGVDSAREWIADVLALTLASFEAPLMLEAMRALKPAAAACPQAREHAVAALDEQALAARETAELRLESEQMGYSLMQWLAAVSPAEQAVGLEPSAGAPQAPQRHSLAVAWARAAVRLELEPRDAALGLLWTFVENQVMVLMKALPLGQMAAQRLLFELGPEIERAADQALRLPREHWSSAAPGLAIASMRHETQYSRLFRS